MREASARRDSKRVKRESDDVSVIHIRYSSG